MKSTVFVRPNLKMFVLGAIGLLVIQHLITSVRSEGTALLRPAPATAREGAVDEVEALLKQAAATPSCALYLRISETYEKRGDYKKALLYLRRADKFGPMDASLD